MASQPAPMPIRCEEGQHRARRTRLNSPDGKIHSICLDCGCPLVRTEATRRWYYSGPLS